MTRDYGKVRAQFWESESLRGMSVPAKFLALYLLTSPHTNAIGCFRLPIAYICHDTGLTDASLESAIAELRRADFALPCERLPWIYIPNYLVHNPPENPNVWRKCLKELETLPPGLSSATAISQTLYDMAVEERMSKDGSKNRVSDEERNRLEPYRNGIETVSQGLRPIPSPNLDLTEPNLTSDKSDPSLPEPQPVKKKAPYPEAFEAFWREYPTDPLMSKKKAHEQWQRLSAQDRDAARAAIPAFKAHCKKNPTYRPVHANRFFSERRFDGFAKETIDPEQLAAQMDRADRIQKRGKYAENYQ